MNKEVIKRYKKEFDAWLDGAEIEIEDAHAWRVHDPLWVNGVKYRIKPEPIERWIALLGNKVLGSEAFETERDCEKYWFGRCKFIKAIKLVQADD